VANFTSDEGGILEVLIEGAEMKDEVMLGRKELDTNTLLVMRTFVNLFDAEEGRSLMLKSYEKVVISEVDTDCRCLRLPRLAQQGPVANPSKLRSARFFSSLSVLWLC
jgi:hypothetical protein